jgi:hypothetical protein
MLSCRNYKKKSIQVGVVVMFGIKKVDITT